MNETTRDDKIKEAVRESYGSIARRFTEQPAPDAESERATEELARPDCCGQRQAVTVRQSTGCCGPSQVVEESEGDGCCGVVQESRGRTTAASRFYPSADIADLPDTVTDASLGCGNPIAIAELEPGEVVLDLGSGGGIDCFMAAKHVGPAGKVIGLDMTPDMIKLARRNAKKVGAQNVEFRYGEMEEMPLPDASVDVIISNCVINLSPDKDAVFGEAYRVLRPGGRLSVSDMVVDGDLPPAIRDSLNAWAGCIAGALDESLYLEKIRAAGFEKVEVVSRTYAGADSIDLEEAQIVVVGSDGEVVEGAQAKALLAENGVSAQQLAQKVASIKVKAYKPL